MMFMILSRCTSASFRFLRWCLNHCFFPSPSSLGEVSVKQLHPRTPGAIPSLGVEQVPLLFSDEGS